MSQIQHQGTQLGGPVGTYLYATIRDKEVMAEPSINVEFKRELVQQADRVEVWSTTFNNPGTDYNLFRLMNGQEVLAEVRQEGF